MTEYLDAYDKNGHIIKTQERKILLKEIKEYSDKHGDANFAVPVFHLFLINTKGQIYVIQRANKPEDPFLYDKTVGGHIQSGESYPQSLAREGDEEIGVEMIVADPKDYDIQIKKTDLTKSAVIRAVDINKWSKSIRKVKDGKSWIKRDHAVTYIGMYNGPVKYKDGEAIGCIMLTLNELEKEMKINPNKFSYDLKILSKKFRKYLIK